MKRDVEPFLKRLMVVLLTLRAECSLVTSKPAHLSPYLPESDECADTTGKLGEYSDKSGPIIGNQAEYSDKAVNYMTDAASRAEASMQLMEIGIAFLIMKNVVLPGIRLALEICPNLGAPVFWAKVRTRGSQPSICVRIFTQFTNYDTCLSSGIPRWDQIPREPLGGNGNTEAGRHAYSGYFPCHLSLLLLYSARRK